MIKLAIFDLDGTLLNTIEDLWMTTNAAMRHFGYKEHSLEAVQGFVGNGIYKLIERSVPIEARDEENIQKVKAVFDGYYSMHSQDHTRPYEGIITLLDHLNEKGIMCGVVTNKAHDYAKTLIGTYFGERFQMVIGQREGVATKPDPVAVLEMMAAFHIEKEACVYIGDSDVDIHTGHNAGIEAIGVLWGFRSEAVLREAGATLFADTPQALEALLLK